MKLSPPRTAQARREFVRAVTSLGGKGKCWATVDTCRTSHQPPKIASFKIIYKGQRSWMIGRLVKQSSFFGVLPSTNTFWAIADVISYGKSESFLVTVYLCFIDAWYQQILHFPDKLQIPSRSSNIADTWKMGAPDCMDCMDPDWKMGMGIFQPAMLVYQRVPWGLGKTLRYWPEYPEASVKHMWPVDPGGNPRSPVSGDCKGICGGNPGGSFRFRNYGNLPIYIYIQNTKLIFGLW